MKYLLEVTQTDIDKANGLCPISLAVKRRLTCFYAHTETWDIYDYTGGRVYYRYTDKEIPHYAIISSSLAKSIIKGSIKPCILILDTNNKKLYEESFFHYIWRRLTDVLRP